MLTVYKIYSLTAVVKRNMRRKKQRKYSFGGQKNCVAPTIPQAIFKANMLLSIDDLVECLGMQAYMHNILSRCEKPALVDRIKQN